MAEGIGVGEEKKAMAAAPPPSVTAPPITQINASTTATPIHNPAFDFFRVGTYTTVAPPMAVCIAGIAARIGSFGWAMACLSSRANSDAV